jgi:hypothetical protein
MTTIASPVLRGSPPIGPAGVSVCDRVLEARQRKAVHIAEHRGRRKDSFRVELERRLLGQ